MVDALKMRTAMPSACCLLPEELSRPFCGGRRTVTEVLKGQGRAVCLLGRPRFLPGCRGSIKGTAMLRYSVMKKQ